MNGSDVTENTAGIESMAKSTSVISMTTRAASRGVATRRPSSTTKKLRPSVRAVKRKRR